MKPPIRQQLEDAQTRASFGDLCGIACTLEEDRTRQEFKDEVNINRIIRSSLGFPLAPVYGDVDFDNLDRQSLELQTRAANELFASLSPELRRGIGSPAGLVELASKGWTPPAPTPPPVPVSAQDKAS